MKKILTIILFFVAVSASAQHLKFMGIPLDGSIDVFHSKLLTKGLSYDKEVNNHLSLPNGSVYEGVFCGYKAHIYTFFDTKTNVIYRSKACIINDDLKYIKRIYNEIAEMLKDKYKWACFVELEHEGYDSFNMFVLKDSDSDCDSKDYLGVIQLYISDYQTGFSTSYTLHIDYVDRINSQNAQYSKSDDL